MYQQKRPRIFAAETITHMSLIHVLNDWELDWAKRIPEVLHVNGFIWHRGNEAAKRRVGFAIAFPHAHNNGHNRNSSSFPWTMRAPL